MMKKLITSKTIRALGMAAGLCLSAITLHAQDGPGPGSFDPAQMRQRRLEQIREALAVSDDAEWNTIAERVGKVMDLRRSARGLSGGPGGPGGPIGFGRPRPGGPGGPPPQADNGAPPDSQDNPGTPREFRGPPGGPGRPGGFQVEPSPEAEALQKAIQAKAPTAELKSKLAELKSARLKNRADLEKAQDELRQLLTVQQEAVAVTMGLL